jgi:hypothetical protein
MFSNKYVSQKISKGIYLAILSLDQYGKSNTYIPAWWIVEDNFLNRNKNMFQKWVNIKHLLLKFSQGKAPCRHFIEEKGKLKYFKKNNSFVNVLLAFCVKSRTWNNLCYPYGISNSVYYNLHKYQFRGWIDLEDIGVSLPRR